MTRLRQWLSDLTVAECPDCGARVPALARTCASCGARNPGRRRSIAVASALAVFTLAVFVAAVAALGWLQLPAGNARQYVGPDDDFGWLETAMKECDEQAAKEPATLQFLIIPLAAKPGDEAGWRSTALNDIGNAILLSSEDSLSALRKGSLQITMEEYLFSIRDQATNVVFKWNRSRGVAQFSTTKVEDTDQFRIQFRTRARARADEWGNVFVRQKGTCYWVNAIIGN